MAEFGLHSDGGATRTPRRGRRAALLSSLTIAGGLATAAVSTGPAIAKTPGETYCLLGHCHRVLSILETLRRVGRTEVVDASYYDDCRRDRFNACGLTSSGEVFRPDAPDNVASPIYPNGTALLLFNPATGAAAVVRVNNAGPYHPGRLIDVSRATAEALDFRAAGTARLEVRVLAAPAQHEAIYRKRRRYDPVHGQIGRHASIAAAHAALRAATSDYGLPVVADSAPPGVVALLPQPAADTLSPVPSRGAAIASAPAPGPIVPRPAGDAPTVATLARLDQTVRAADLPEPPVARFLSAARERARRGAQPVVLTDAALADARAVVASLLAEAAAFARRARIAARAGLATPRATSRAANEPTHEGLEAARVPALIASRQAAAVSPR